MPTVAPRSANATAVAAPIPDDAPVTRTFTRTSTRSAARSPSFHPTLQGPATACLAVGSAIDPRNVPGVSTTSTGTSWPVSSPKKAHHSWTLTASSPPQFTIARGHGRGVEQGRGLAVDVVLVDRHVGTRVPAGGDALARDRGVEVVHGQAAVGAVRSVHAGDRHRQVVEARRTCGPRPPRAIFDMEYGGEIDELTSPSGSVSTYTCSGSSLRPVHRVRRHHQRGLRSRGSAASSSPVPSAFTVIAWSKSMPGPWYAARCTTYVKSSGTPVKSPVAMSHDAGGHAERVDLRPALLVGEARDAPHLVVGGEVAGERERDLPSRSGDEDLLARQHGPDATPTRYGAGHVTPRTLATRDRGGTARPVGVAGRDPAAPRALRTRARLPRHGHDGFPVHPRRARRPRGAGARRAARVVRHDAERTEGVGALRRQPHRRFRRRRPRARHRLLPRRARPTQRRLGRRDAAVLGHLRARRQPRRHGVVLRPAEVPALVHGRRARTAVHTAPASAPATTRSPPTSSPTRSSRGAASGTRSAWIP